MDIDRRSVLKGLGVAGVAGYAATEVSGTGPDPSRSADWGTQRVAAAYDDYSIHRVAADGSADYETIQAAVAAANPRDVVLVEPGVYREAVLVSDTPRLTIRGTDRDAVILDGEYDRANGIQILVNDVVVENLTVRNFGNNGVYWTGDTGGYSGGDGDIEGYRASHVVAYNNGTYGIYAYRSVHGRFEHCYASGSDDAGYYIGGVQPGHAVITDCIAENNAQGFSGTNTGGDVVLKDSIWRHNVAGITPNTLDSQRNPPQGHVAGGIRIENNEIYANNNLDAPAGPIAYALFGNGITIVGGTNNDVVDNHVHDQAKYGIAVTPVVDDNFYRARDNAVHGNRVENSGRQDLALAFPARNNSFDGNEVSTTRPAFLQHRDGSLGDLWVFCQMLPDFVQAEFGGDYPHGETADQPPPDEETLADLATMDEPETAPPRPPIGVREP